MKKKTHWKKLHNTNYLGAYSLMNGSETTDLTVKIKKVVRDNVTGADGNKQECTIAYLYDNKPFILNSTNQKSITKSIGSPYIEDWKESSITIYVANIRAFGENVDCLRVRSEKSIDVDVFVSEMKALIEIKREALTDSEIAYCDRILQEKEQSSFDKLNNFLKSK